MKKELRLKKEEGVSVQENVENREKELLELKYLDDRMMEAQEEEYPPASGVMYWLANGLSLVLHPLFMPVVLFSLIFYFAPRITAPLPEENRMTMFNLLLLVTVVIPLLIMVLMRLFGGLKSLHMAERKLRLMPFSFVSVFYAFTTYFFISTYQPFLNISIMLAGISVLMVLLTLITFYWKISVHSAAICGVLGFLASFMLLYQELQLLYPLAGIIVLAGLLMSARLYLNTHRPGEVWAGAFLGFATCFSCVFVFSFL